MHRSIQTLAVAAALLLALSLLVGCSKGRRSAKPETGPAALRDDASRVLGNLAKGRAALTSYKMTTEIGDETIVQAMKLRDGQPVRVKAEMGREGQIVLVLLDRKVQYMYDPKTKTAMKIPMEDTNAADSEKPGLPPLPDPSALASTVLKTDTVDGIECWLLEVTGSEGEKVRSWVDKRYGLPRQEEIGGKLIKHTYEQINSVPDSEFELPPGTKVRDMSEMMPPNMPPPPPPGP